MQSSHKIKQNISILKSYKKWNEQKEIDRKHIKLVLGKILSSHENFNSLKLVELSILFTDDKEIIKLNQTYRDKNGPTNVLSFPDKDEPIYDKKILCEELYLGDIAFSYDQVLRESIEGHISFYNHFTHLLIHGILHLIGYDHQDEKDAQKMESLEVRLLKIFNIPTPY